MNIEKIIVAVGEMIAFMCAILVTIMFAITFSKGEKIATFQIAVNTFGEATIEAILLAVVFPIVIYSMGTFIYKTIMYLRGE